jgi:hypothetical protein
VQALENDEVTGPDREVFRAPANGRGLRVRKIDFGGLKSRVVRPAGLLAFPLIVASIPAVVPARQAPSPQPVQVLETAQLMEEMFEPLYGELTRAVATPPANRQAWRAVLSPGAKLAELHNLLF